MRHYEGQEIELQDQIYWALMGKLTRFSKAPFSQLERKKENEGIGKYWAGFFQAHHRVVFPISIVAGWDIMISSELMS